MPDLILTLSVPPEMQIEGEASVSGVDLDPGSTASANCSVSAPPGKYTLKVEADAAGMLPIYADTVVAQAGPAKLKIQLQGPSIIELNNNATVDLIVRNTGGYPTDAVMTIQVPSGLGGIQDTFSINALAGGDTETWQTSLTGITSGSHAMVASSKSEDGSTTTATKVVTVQEHQLQMTVTLSPNNINQGFSGDLDLILKSDSQFPENVRIRGISSGPDIHYEIYDGSGKPGSVLTFQHY